MATILSPIEQQLQREILTKDGHQNWIRIKETNFGDSQTEISIMPYETWAEPSDEDSKQITERGKGDRERSQESAAKRAKRKVRHKAKMLGVRYMVTLTTKQIIDDIDAMQTLFQEFVRRLRKVSDFQYIAVYEYQKRGALHLHIAVPNRQDYKLLWSIWYAIVGKDQGRVHVTSGSKKSSVGQISAYISKYIVKSFQDGELNRRRYWASKDIDKPTVKIHLLRPDWTPQEVLKYMYEILQSKGWSKLDLLSHWQNMDKKLFWFAYET